MNEITAKLEFDEAAIAATFEKLRRADVATREVGCEFIREEVGAEAEAELRRRLAAHDAEMAKRAEPIRRRLPPTVPPKRDVLDVATPGFGTEPKAQPEPQAEPKPAPVRFASEIPKHGDAPAILSHAAPVDSAKEFVRRNCFRDGMLATYFWRGKFWEWNGRHYETLSAEVVRGRVYAFLDESQKRTMSGEERFRPTPKNVNDFLDALEAGLTPMSKDWQPPMWIDTGQSATNLLVFRNGIVNVLTGERQPLTPRLWVHSGVDYDYEPQASCPQWERFLEEVFPGDRASQDFVEEWLGYGMTVETKFEKAAMWIGKRRSGKGTIAFIQRRLIGDGDYVGLSFTNWLATENSAACMIGKRVGVFPDVRLKQGKHYGASYDAGGLTHNSIEMLLKITGRDHVSLGRKHIDHWEGQLRVKLTLISNDPLNFNDATLISRFIKINFAQSFWGKEDTDLRNKLEAEISGIANRCIAAYRRLIARGRFVQPQSGLELERRVIAESDAFAAFVNEMLVIDPAGLVNCALLFAKFQSWCEDRGRFDAKRSAPKPHLLTQRLKGVAGLENLATFKAHGGPRQYVGLRLRTKDELEA